MISPTPNNVLEAMQGDMNRYLRGLEMLNKEAVQILVDFYELYLIRGPKPWFGDKVDFEKFLDIITRFTTLKIHPNNSVVSFQYVAPDNYTWKLNDKKLAKLTGSDVNDEKFKTKTRLIRLACLEMFYMACIRETYSTIKHIEMYGTNFLVDRRILNLHSHALESLNRMKLYGVSIS